MKNVYLTKTLRTCILAILFSIFILPEISAKAVDTLQVKQVATNLFVERAVGVTPNSDLKTKIVETVSSGNINLYYVVEVSNENETYHAVISAEDAVYPVLSYAFRPYPEQAKPPAYQDWMENIQHQIAFVASHQLKAPKHISKEWSYYLNLTPSNKKNVKAVAPLLNAEWDQGDPYNLDCPYSSTSMYNNNHVPVGCVAIAMGQIMHFHGHPTTGNGSHSYTSNYGTESANFGNTTYNWSNMPNSLNSSSPTSQKNAVAELLYHCGVSVDMNYGDNGSGAYTGDAMLALGNYFDYNSQQMSYDSKNNSSNWDWKIKNDLDNNRPILYRGEKSSGGGHAFVLDGYQGSSNNHYHFNWGWGSYFNNYCYLSSLVPANTTGYNYSYNQQGIFGIEPNGGTGSPNVQYLSKQIIDDNVNQSSGNNNGQVDPGETIELIITLQNTGSATASNVSATLSTSDPDITITDGSEDFGSINAQGTASCVYDYDFDVSSTCIDKDVTFTLSITDDNNNTWTDNFTIHVYGSSGYCNGTTTITTSSGTFSDGSGTNDYADDSDCKWLIQPSSGGVITLDFTSFSTEAGYDMVEVYDGSTTSATLLGTFSGNSLPSAVTSTGNSMLVHFTSDYSNTAAGWTANFTTAAASSPTLVFESGVVDDDNNEQSSGNDNGQADPGETIELLIELKNTGTGTAYGVSANLSTTDPDITITDADENYGDIAPQATAWTEYDYDFEISANCPAKDVPFVLTITDNNGNTWTENLVLHVYGVSNTYCSGLTQLTNGSGTITDGSGNNDYENDADCRWLIKPQGASSVTLNFTSFDTESGYDYVKIYQGNSTSGTLLLEHSGSSIPSSPITSSTGKMLLVFTSDYSNTAGGWAASYTSDTGIDDFNNKKAFKIYPNPSNGNFHIQSQEPLQENMILRLLNAQGQLVYQQTLAASGHELELKLKLQHLASGMYHMNITGKEKQYSQKIIIE